MADIDETDAVSVKVDERWVFRCPCGVLGPPVGDKASSDVLLDEHLAEAHPGTARAT
jgi:hypothetical protein